MFKITVNLEVSISATNNSPRHGITLLTENKQQITMDRELGYLPTTFASNRDSETDALLG